MIYRCRKCGKEFEQKPLEHGDFVGSPITGYKHQKCDGEIERMSQDYEKLRNWAKKHD